MKSDIIFTTFSKKDKISFILYKNAGAVLLAITRERRGFERL